MQNITVHRYNDPGAVGFQGYIEPDDASWIMFVRNDGMPIVYLNRTATGAVIV